MNHNYAVDIPSLPALASGINEEAVAPEIQEGDAMNDEHVIAAQNQYKNRKKLRDFNAALITNEELVSSKKRMRLVESVHFVDPGQPQWAVQMQQQMNQMQQQTQQQMNQMQQQLHEVIAGIQLLNQEAERTRNRVCVRTNDDEITPMRRQEDGAYPLDHGVWWPNDVAAIWNATSANLDALLQFYGLAIAGNLDLKRQHLRTFLGISI